jgi:hypothetical protein
VSEGAGAGLGPLEPLPPPHAASASVQTAIKCLGSNESSLGMGVAFWVDGVGRSRPAADALASSRGAARCPGEHFPRKARASQARELRRRGAEFARRVTKSASSRPPAAPSLRRSVRAGGGRPRWSFGAARSCIIRRNTNTQGSSVRTISIRLDEHTDALLSAFCRRHGVTQTDAIKAAVDQLAGRLRPTPAELAAELGLIGGFKSSEGDLARNHSLRIKEKLRAKRARESVPAVPGPDAAPRAKRRRAAQV